MGRATRRETHRDDGDDVDHAEPFGGCLASRPPPAFLIRPAAQPTLVPPHPNRATPTPPRNAQHSERYRGDTETAGQYGKPHSGRTFVPNENTEIRSFWTSIFLGVAQVFPVVAMPEFDDLKLVWVVFVQKRNRYSHNARVVAGDTRGGWNLDSVVVVVGGVRIWVSLNPLIGAQVLVHRHER